MTLEIEANESGRLWSDDPDEWRRLCTPEGCPMCGDDPHPEWVLAETELCRISAWSQAVLPGYACVLSKRHVIEPFELAEDEQASFFLDAMATARGLANLFGSVKMNYEIHGNTLPHLHSISSHVPPGTSMSDTRTIAGHSSPAQTKRSPRCVPRSDRS
jgi:diadenosine tetraphosphate (Ap4A) HIT family hydrolase